MNGACSADLCHIYNKRVAERRSKIIMTRLTPKRVLLLDKNARTLIINYGNQSDCHCPNIKKFSKGISNSAKFRSDQHITRVLVIYLVLLTPVFKEIIMHKKG